MNFRCEFCEIALKSDLDVSKHLISQTHRDNVDKARKLHPLENAKGKDVPTNIAKLYENLKLRTVHDVRDLADRGYFRLPADATETVKVVDAINRVLVKNVAEHLARNLGPAAKQEILNSLHSIKREPPERRQPQKSPVQQQPARPPQPSPQVPHPESRPSTSKADSPDVDFRPAPAYTPLFTSNPRPAAAAPRPNAAGSRQVPPTRNVRPNLPQTASNQRAPGPTRKEPRPNIPQPATRTIPSTSNPFTQVPRPAAPRPNIPSWPPRQPAHVRPTPPQPRMAAPPIRMGVPLQQRTTAPSTRPVVPPQPRATAPPTRPVVPPPAPSPMAGACFMPRPLVDEPPPQPRPDSTYRPKLAQIKIEPKDK